MPLDTATYFGLLDLTNPRGTDSRSLSDDFHRVMRESCQIQFPNLTDEVTATQDDLNAISGLAASGDKLLTGTGGVTVLYMYNSTPPTGYTQVNLDGEIRNLVMGPSTGGTFAGTDSPISYSLTVSVTGTGLTDTNGAHSHSGTAAVTATGDLNVQDGSGPDQAARQSHTHTVTVGPDGAHNHLVDNLSSTGSTSTHNPRYARGILVQLDA